MDTSKQNFTLGNPSIEPGKRVYAIGDVHGRFDLLENLLEIIMADASSDQDNVLVFLGDYVDRGPNSRRVIEQLTMPVPSGFDIVCLKGNHEDLLLKFLAGTLGARDWLNNGGIETLNSYGVDTSNLYFSPSYEELEQSRLDLVSALPESHLDFLTSLDLMHFESDYLFVHAGIRPGISFDRQEEMDLIWIRKEFLDSDEDFGKIIVHGHSITVGPTIGPNRIGIDTGAWHSNVLTSLVLEGSDMRFLNT